MNIYKIENVKKIMENEKVNNLLASAMFNPTEGRIKTVAEGIYAKQQGSFYICELEEIVGIIGVRRVDNAFIQIMHIAVDEKHRKEGIGKAMVSYVRDAQRVDEIIAETDSDAVGFYKKLGFSIEEQEDRMTGLVRFVCRLKG